MGVFLGVLGFFELRNAFLCQSVFAIGSVFSTIFCPAKSREVSLGFNVVVRYDPWTMPFPSTPFYPAWHAKDFNDLAAESGGFFVSWLIFG
jgi:hypothetical protein